MAIVVNKMPLDTYAVTSHWGPRYVNGVYGFHRGIDLKANAGQKVYSIQNGVVKNVAFDSDGYGNYVVIEHEGYGFCTLYAHLLSSSVKIGQFVYAGVQIGLADNTGHSFGSHLHLEIIAASYSKAFGMNYNERVSKYNVNPESHLKKLQDSLFGGTSFGGGSVQTTDVDPTTAAAESQVNVLGDESVGSLLFRRKYRIIVSDDNGNGIDVSDLHVIFSCHKTITLDNSTSIVKVYNLDSNTESRLIQYASHISIEAGYDGLYGLIFEGDVIQGIRYKENATDFVLEIVALDGDRLQSSAFNSLAVPRGQTQREIIGAVTSGFGATVNVTEDINIKRYIRGKSVFETAENTLKQIMNSNNGMVYVEDGVLNLTKLSDVPSGEIIKLDYSSGLIGVPMQSSNQITFKALINPRIKLNTLVHIDNSAIKEQMYADGSDLYRLDADGVYRIITVDFSGDTRGNDWYIECGAASQAGAIPALLANINSDVY